MTEYVLGVERSVRGRAWKFRAPDETKVEAFAQQTGHDMLSARLMLGRGVEVGDSSRFLEPKLRDYLPDPSSITDIDKAVGIIMDAVLSNKSITIFADYDVDGATSASQLVRWGRSLGVEMSVYVPDRVLEGYGPNIDAFKALKRQGTDLVITVDCGAAAHDSLVAARDIDLDIVVVDHHMMGEDMPPCAALINPNRFDDKSGLGHLAAAGVVFMLVIALNRDVKRRGIKCDFDPMSILGLAALGSVCDVVPLTGLNRALVSQGLKVLSNNNILGIKALADISERSPPFTIYDLGFILGPRINAGGRIGQASMGAELLGTEDAQLAYKNAAELDRVNQERRQLQDKILREATDLVVGRLSDDPVIVVAMEGWHAGVIGIVAGRIKDQFGKPAIVIGVDEDGQAKGSGRSIKGVDLGEAVMAAKRSGLLLSGGGHPMAAGMSLRREDVDNFRAFICDYLSAQVITALTHATYEIDSLLFPSAVILNTLDVIDRIGPYGSGNPEPVFVLPKCRVSYAKRLNGGHVRCTLSATDGAQIGAICFRADSLGLAETLLSASSQTLNVSGRLKRNNWQGRERVDFHITDISHI